MLDFNGALGSWQGRAKEKWQGCRYRWDVEKQIQWVFTLGTARTCGVRAHPKIVSKTLGYIRLEFEPLRWRGEKPNTAFDRMTDEDAAWMAEKIARFSREQLQAIIA